ncbi:DNA polymerase III subunit tau [Clostridium acetireducens DSM 10703]|jgi:DNA polymerase-3 subunit gamma/tau|uniref:DNA-directed DNA polymerase n=1 Tax=Clostridium acetireducens DSM 10703 TaxID=1121290 RepID=A0A1E8EX87_9CLOT|nr:DNA polymerase III subunit gamma/tau [Clostridium acetireducens]OFI04983.1 DNA polymerase III subunit tau [Clostridium acetireducens DSM 10703]
MAYTALYREWRPRKFEDVVGQSHITVTLKNQIIHNRIAHAYLFCGTRGTGKTSTAKILAKAVNCLNIKDGEPCNECDMCKKINSGILMDVVELDAASNNGIDKIREIIENVQYHPSEAKFKVYIMDEVHMLSQGAVNAFLKTLEEPPSNVIFILATTDPQKLPITILSRCQRFDFKRIKKQDIFNRLRNIVTDQGVLADDRSLELISRLSDGAMRDALSVLDQAISTGNNKVEYDNVIKMLGLVTYDNLFKITDAIIRRDVEQSIKIIDNVVYSGKDVYVFIKELINHMRNLLISKISNDLEEIIDLSLENIENLKRQSENIRTEELMRNIRILQEVEKEAKWIKQSRICLEMAVIKMCRIEYDSSKEVIVARLNNIEGIIKSGKILNIKNIKNNVVKTDNKELIYDKIEKEDNNQYNNKKEILNENQSSVINENDIDIDIDLVKKKWKDILETFKARRLMVLYASLITAQIYACKGNKIILKYDKNYAFNKKRLEKEDNRKIVEDIFSEILKIKSRVEYIVENENQLNKSPEEILKDTFGEDLVDIINE